MSVECPVTGDIAELDDASDGDDYECPYCGADVVVEDGEALHAKLLEVKCPVTNDHVTLPGAEDGDEYTCPDCRADVTIEDGRARHSRVRSPSKHTTTVRRIKK